MRMLYRLTVAGATVVAFAAPAAAQDLPRQLDALRWPLPQPDAALAAQAAPAARAREAAARQREAQRRLREAREAQQREMVNWPQATESFSRTVRLGRNGTFELQNLAGDIVITGGGGDDVRIQATKRMRHRNESQARTALQSLGIDVIERGGHVEVRTQYPRRSGNAIAAVDYSVAVPAGATVVVATVSGNVRVSNVGGELRVNAISGNITTSGVRRVRQLSTVSGNVEVADAESDELTASTVDGDVVLRNVKGRVLQIDTVTGDARLIDVQLDRVRLQSMAGDLEFTGRLARSGRYEFQTHSGDIRVSPSGNPGFDLDATTFSGDVRSDFAMKATTGARGVQRTLRGTFGDAGAVVSAQSFAGDILIVRR